MSLRFIGPFEILERVEYVVYKIALPPSLAIMHNVFHVSMLQKYTSDLTHVIEYETLLLEELAYEEKSVRILACDTRRLCNKVIFLVNVSWGNHHDGDAT